MVDTLFIFIGAGFGGVLRHWFSSLTHLLLGRQFPYGTLFVNVTGSLVMGFLFALFIERLSHIGPHMRSFLLIGLLGGYTTFSSFSIETFSLFERSEFMLAFTNIFLSLFLCIVAAWLGVIAGRQL